MTRCPSGSGRATSRRTSSFAAAAAASRSAPPAVGQLLRQHLDEGGHGSRIDGISGDDFVILTGLPDHTLRISASQVVSIRWKDLGSPVIHAAEWEIGWRTDDGHERHAHFHSAGMAVFPGELAMSPDEFLNSSGLLASHGNRRCIARAGRGHSDFVVGRVENRRELGLGDVEQRLDSFWFDPELLGDSLRWHTDVSQP